MTKYWTSIGAKSAVGVAGATAGSVSSHPQVRFRYPPPGKPALVNIVNLGRRSVGFDHNHSDTVSDDRFFAGGF